MTHRSETYSDHAVQRMEAAVKVVNVEKVFRAKNNYGARAIEMIAAQNVRTARSRANIPLLGSPRKIARLAAVLFCGAVCSASHSVAGEGALGSKSDYVRYVEPILTVTDFGTRYTEDGAGDASVLRRFNGKSPDPIMALLRLGPKALPLLIDCLMDGRVTSMRFSGSTVSKPMNVPIGYVCLDVLMGTIRGPVSEPECADDGMGACMKQEFYFRPDDYSQCWPDFCLPRPWVRVVQENWKRLYQKRKLRFENPSQRPLQ